MFNFYFTFILFPLMSFLNQKSLVINEDTPKISTFKKQIVNFMTRNFTKKKKKEKETWLQLFLYT